MEAYEMTEKEQTQVLIDRLMDVRRAKNSADSKKELENQEKVLIVKLEAMGITVTDLPEMG